LLAQPNVENNLVSLVGFVTPREQSLFRAAKVPFFFSTGYLLTSFRRYYSQKPFCPPFSLSVSCLPFTSTVSISSKSNFPPPFFSSRAPFTRAGVNLPPSPRRVPPGNPANYNQPRQKQRRRRFVDFFPIKEGVDTISSLKSLFPIPLSNPPAKVLHVSVSYFMVFPERRALLFFVDSFGLPKG